MISQTYFYINKMTSVFTLPRTSTLDQKTHPPIVNILASADDISGVQTARQELWTSGRFRVQGVDVELDTNILIRSGDKASATNGLYTIDKLKAFAKALEIPNTSSMKKPNLIDVILSKVRELTGSRT